MKDFMKYVLATAVGTILGAFFCVVLIVCLVLGLANLSGKFTQQSSKIEKGSVLVLNLNRPIKESSDELSYVLGGYMSPTLRQMTEAIQFAASDDKINGIYLKLSQVPQGWSTLKSIRQALTKFKTSKKFIYAYSEFYNEKSYYLASVANKVFMHPKGEFAWDGFASVPTFYKNLFEKIGVRPVIFRVGKYKSAVEPLIQTKMSESNKAQVSELIDDIWQDVISVVSTSRKLDALSVERMAENLEIRTADEALERGLVDGLKLDSEIFEKLLIAKSLDKIKKKDKNLLTDISTYIFANKDKFNTSTGSIFGTELTSQDKEIIAIINIEGAITSGRNTEDGVGAEDIMGQIRKAKYDKNIKGVVIRVNSPGGSALASEVVWSELKKLQEIKPVYASFGDVAASGGYYIGVAAEKIFAHPNTITGSIGVFSVLMDIQKGANKHLGLSFDRVVTHPYADMGSSVRNMTKTEVKFFQEDTNRVYHRFIDVVQAGRQFEAYDDVHAIAQGRVWSGTQAKQIGLVDEMGNLDDTIASLAGDLELSEDYRVQILRPEMNFELLFGSLIFNPSFMKAYLPTKWSKVLKYIDTETLGVSGQLNSDRVWAIAPELDIQ